MSQDYLREKSSTALEIIEFYLDEVMPDGSEYRSYYGMNVAKVLEIIRMPSNITSVPGAQHPAALGTFNLRNRVMPLVDLGVWLEKKKCADINNLKVVVSEFSGIVTAFVISGVTRIHRISWAQVEPPSKYLQAFSHGSVNGVVRFDERIVFLLDLEQILASMNPELGLEILAQQIHHDPQAGVGRNILLADDSGMIRKTIAGSLGAAGYTVVQAVCGSEAWNILEQWKQESLQGEVPVSSLVDLVISDIEMPGLDGHELTRRIKTDPVLHNLPVVLFSSLITDIVKEAGIKAGADVQLSKPDLPQLVTRVQELIEKSQAEHA